MGFYVLQDENHASTPGAGRGETIFGLFGVWSIKFNVLNGRKGRSVIFLYMKFLALVDAKG